MGGGEGVTASLSEVTDDWLVPFAYNLSSSTGGVGGGCRRSICCAPSCRDVSSYCNCSTAANLFCNRDVTSDTVTCVLDGKVACGATSSTPDVTDCLVSVMPGCSLDNALVLVDTSFKAALSTSLSRARWRLLSCSSWSRSLLNCRTRQRASLSSSSRCATCAAATPDEGLPARKNFTPA